MACPEAYLPVDCRSVNLTVNVNHHTFFFHRCHGTTTNFLIIDHHEIDSLGHLKIQLIFLNAWVPFGLWNKICWPFFLNVISYFKNVLYKHIKHWLIWWHLGLKLLLTFAREQGLVFESFWPNDFLSEKKANSKFEKKYRFHSDLLQNECLEPWGCPR